MARSSYSLSGLRWHGQSLQLAPSPPQLSQTGASPAVRRNEAGCGNVPGRGLSRMKGQLSRTVRKAGWWAAMPTWLPDYLKNGKFYLINDTIPLQGVLLLFAWKAGRMFWLSRNRLVGSYLFFNATRRS